MGQLRLVWAKDPGLTKAVGKQDTLTLLLSMLSRWRGNINHVIFQAL